MLCLTGADSADLVHAAWNHDESRCLTSHRGGETIIWDAQTGQPLHRLSGHAGYVLGTSWSSDDRKVLAWGTDHRAIVWDALTGERLLVLSRSPADVMHAEWLSGDRQIMMYYADGGSTTWDAVNADRLLSVNGERSPEDTPPEKADELMTIAHVEGSERISVASMDDLVTLSCSQAGRNMTQAEWERYLGSDVPYRETCPRQGP